jgi:hypothetical protein
VIVSINQYANKQFLKNGGRDLLGANLLDYHPEPSRSQLTLMLMAPTISTYTVEKSGIKRIIHQTPNFTKGVIRRVIEISFDIPNEIPHFNRD